MKKVLVTGADGFIGSHLHLTVLASVHVLQMLPVMLRFQSSFYFPRSAIKISISCSLIPTIASPKSSESSAISFASV